MTLIKTFEKISAFCSFDNCAACIDIFSSHFLTSTKSRSNEKIIKVFVQIRDIFLSSKSPELTVLVSQLRVCLSIALCPQRDVRVIFPNFLGIRTELMTRSARKLIYRFISFMPCKVNFLSHLTSQIANHRFTPSSSFEQPHTFATFAQVSGDYRSIDDLNGKSWRSRTRPRVQSHSAAKLEPRISNVVVFCCTKTMQQFYVHPKAFSMISIRSQISLHISLHPGTLKTVEIGAFLEQVSKTWDDVNFCANKPRSTQRKWTKCRAVAFTAGRRPRRCFSTSHRKTIFALTKAFAIFRPEFSQAEREAYSACSRTLESEGIRLSM